MQLAKLAGNKVIATCGGTDKAKLLKDLGVDRIIDYKSENIKTVRFYKIISLLIFMMYKWLRDRKVESTNLYVSLEWNFCMFCYLINSRVLFLCFLETAVAKFILWKQKFWNSISLKIWLRTLNWGESKYLIFEIVHLVFISSNSIPQHGTCTFCFWCSIIREIFKYLSPYLSQNDGLFLNSQLCQNAVQWSPTAFRDFLNFQL